MPSPASLSADQSAEFRTPMHQLASKFVGDMSELGQFTAVPTAELPPTYAGLLSHHDHMTVTLEKYHGGPVSVRVVSEHVCKNYYTRNSLLSRHSDNRVVQFGIMKVYLAGLPAVVREKIEQHTAPLGRILIEHNLLREVQLQALWRITVGPTLADCFGIKLGDTIYGRTANIRVANEPRIDLLEIVHIDESADQEADQQTDA